MGRSASFMSSAGASLYLEVWVSSHTHTRTHTLHSSFFFVHLMCAVVPVGSCGHRQAFNLVLYCRTTPPLFPSPFLSFRACGRCAVGSFSLRYYITHTHTHITENYNNNNERFPTPLFHSLSTIVYTTTRTPNLILNSFFFGPSVSSPLW